MRAFADVPTPRRRYTYPPTFGAQRPAVVVGACTRPVGEETVRTGRLRRKQVVTVKCGGRVLVRRRKDGRHRAYCRDCRARKEQRKQIQRILQRVARFTPREQAQAERREVSRFRRFARRGR